MIRDTLIDYQLDELLNWETNKELARQERDAWIIDNYDQLIFSIEVKNIDYQRTEIVYVTDRKTRIDRYKILFYVPGKAQLYLENIKLQYKQRLQ